jgi:hypothetical protein
MAAQRGAAGALVNGRYAKLIWMQASAYVGEARQDAVVRLTVPREGWRRRQSPD